MNTLIPVAFLATLALAACSSTSTQDAESKAATKPPPELFRVGSVAFHTDTAIVGLPVSNMAASKAWYARVLGSTVVYEVPEQQWCEITTPAKGTLLGLHEQQGATIGSANALGMSVVDMAVARAHLVAQGVKLENDVIEIPGIVKLLYFLDPDGNRMWFYAPAG
jgi:predicted enzyme related to lactoylglutathione lyase